MASTGDTGLSKRVVHAEEVALLVESGEPSSEPSTLPIQHRLGYLPVPEGATFTKRDRVFCVVCCVVLLVIILGFESFLQLLIDRTAAAARPPVIAPLQRPCPTPSIWAKGRLYTEQDAAASCAGMPKGTARKHVFVWFGQNDFDSTPTPQETAAWLATSELGLGRYFWGQMLGADHIAGAAYPHSVSDSPAAPAPHCVCSAAGSED